MKFTNIVLMMVVVAATIVYGNPWLAGLVLGAMLWFNRETYYEGRISERVAIAMMILRSTPEAHAKMRVDIIAQSRKVLRQQANTKELT
jgi:hypothetical protein